MKTLSLLFILTLSLCLSGQSYNFKEIFMEAEYHYSDGEYDAALEKFLIIYQHDSTNYNVCYRIGMCYKEMYQKYEKAIVFLKKATANVSETYIEGYHKERNASVDVFFWLGYIYHNMTLYDHAIEYYNHFLDKVQEWDYASIEITNYKIENCKKALELVKTRPTIEIENAGNSINSGYNDINPCITEDGNTLYFTRVIPLIKKEDDEFYDPRLFDFQIFRLTKKDGQWQTPRNITTNINTMGEFITVSVSSTGNKLVLVRDNQYASHYKNIQNGDVYYVEYKNGSYGDIIKFPKKINTKKNEPFASFSPDEQSVFIVSDRNKGKGGFDIYMSTMHENGKWSTPTNLGDSINSAYNETHPIYTKETLFFSSQGHNGIGGYDMYTSKFDSIWRHPHNIGIPINTPSDDTGLYPFNEGTQAVVPISFEGFITFGQTDIYNIDLLERKTAIQPIQNENIATNNIAEKQMDNQTADTTETNVATQENTNSLNTTPLKLTKNTQPADKQANLFDAGLSEQTTIIGMAQEQNTETSNDNIKKQTDSLHNQHVYTKNTKQDAVKKTNNTNLTIRPIYFEYGKHEINKTDKAYLLKIVQYIKEYPSIYFEITGSTDSISSATFNDLLSAKRIQEVVEFMSDNGIDKTRFVTKPMGERSPIATNSMEEGRKFNRRVDITPINKNNIKIDINKIDAISSVPKHLVYTKKNNTILYIGTDNSPIKIPEEVDLMKYSVTNENLNNQTITYIEKIEDQTTGLTLLNNLIEAGLKDTRLIPVQELNYIKSKVKNKEKENATYTIQLAATLKLYNPAKTFPGIHAITIYKGKDGYYRYTCDSCSTLTLAKKTLTEINTKGHTAAFIIPIEKFKNMEKISF